MLLPTLFSLTVSLAVVVLNSGRYDRVPVFGDSSDPDTLR